MAGADPTIVLSTPLRTILRTMLNSPEPVWAYGLSTQHDLSWETTSSCLRRLEKAGWVNVESQEVAGRPRRLYQLTDDGKAIATEKLARGRQRSRGQSRSDMMQQGSLGLS